MPSLNTRETRTPTPSNTLRRIPHATAEPRADLGPPRVIYGRLSKERTETYNHGWKVPTWSTTMKKGQLTASGETATGQETTDDRIPHVFLLSYAFDSTVKSGEHTTPDTEVASCDGSTGFDDGQSTDECCKNSFKMPITIGTFYRQLGPNATQNAAGSSSSDPSSPPYVTPCSSPR